MGELINSLKTAGCPILSEKVKLQLDGVASLLHDGDASRLGARASSVLASASREVALAERDYYSLVIEDSLVDLGYSVTRARGAAACAIEATRGHEVRVFGVSTSRDGAIEVVRDGAGLSGEACHEADVKIVDALERRGVVFGQPRSSRRHGDAKGGALIRELGARARNHSVSLAQAFVSMRDEREGKLGQQSKSSFAKTSDKSKGLYRAHTNSKRKAAHHE